MERHGHESEVVDNAESISNDYTRTQIDTADSNGMQLVTDDSDHVQMVTNDIHELHMTTSNSNNLHVATQDTDEMQMMTSSNNMVQLVSGDGTALLPEGQIIQLNHGNETLQFVQVCLILHKIYFLFLYEIYKDLN